MLVAAADRPILQNSGNKSYRIIVWPARPLSDGRPGVEYVGNRHISNTYLHSFLVGTCGKTNAFCRSTVIQGISDNLF